MARRKGPDVYMYTDGICIPADDGKRGPGWFWIIASAFTIPFLTPVLLFLRGKKAYLRRQLAVYRRYAAVIGERASVTIAEIASVMGRKEATVLHDLRAMIDRGYLGRSAFLDHSRNLLLLRRDAREEARRERAAETVKKKETREAPRQRSADPKTESAPDFSEFELILTRIRTLNEQIRDVSVSEKIDRIGMETASIFSATRLKPEQSGDVKKVFGYYLPTTFKLLEMYALMEAEPRKTQDIRESMRRIESSLDLLITAYARIREDMYRSRTLDVDADIDVLNAMLIKDGLFSPKGTDLREMRTEGM